MDIIKKIWNNINKPRGWALVMFYLLFVVVVAATITLVVVNSVQSVRHYILYVVAATMLAYFVYTIVIFAPKIKTNTIITLKRYKFTSALLDNYGYRTIVFSIFSFIFNLAYLAFIGILAIITKSAWYISITAYYLCLTLMKGNVFHSKLKHNTPIKQARAYRYAGIMLIVMTFAFSGIITLIYTSNMYFEYAGLLIYAIAAFTFYKLVLAIYNIFKARKENNLYIQTIRNINLSSALISIVVLQVAMFQAFSPENNTSIANALTGAGVSAIILVFGVLMIIKSNRVIKELSGGRKE